MLKLRLDVDYPYPSRNKSFASIALNIKTGKDYLKNSKIIAKMINESEREIKAYWFFTPYTTPDKELLELLHPDKHEIALHVATNPLKEWKKLEEATQRKVEYYTVHGTARLAARVIWKRKPWQAKAPIPKDFPLKSFYEYPTLGLDSVCYNNPTAEAVAIAEDRASKGEVLHVHPEWLFQRGTINHRGPFYQTLKWIIGADKDLDYLKIYKRIFVKLASDAKEYEKDIVPTSEFLSKLADRGVDVFSFVKRRWSSTLPRPQTSWKMENDSVALLEVTTYDDWWKNIGKKTRNMVRKAEKSGVETKVARPDGKLAEGIWKIYNETPIRQERAFPHYGEPIQVTKQYVSHAQNDTFIGAYLQDELVGFIHLAFGDNIAIIAQILSLQKHSDKAVNNALVAKAVEACAAKQNRWLMYGRMGTGTHPSLDIFKENNGFIEFPLNRYYIPITRKGRIAIKLGLHKEAKDALPKPIKRRLIPVFNWISRTKTKIKLSRAPKKPQN